LANLAGLQTVKQSRDALALAQSRFFELRAYALEQLVRAMEPRPIGRPPAARAADAARIAELEEEIRSLQLELKKALVREKLARANLPRRSDRGQGTKSKAAANRRSLSIGDNRSFHGLGSGHGGRTMGTLA
jgi:hypothetical protein